MHLLNTRTLRLQRIFDPRQIPHYAVLSHCWGPEEITFEDLRNLDGISQKPGYDKLQHACLAAQAQCLDWIWIDTVCINRSSTAELTEAVNSAFRWYQESQICLVYLCDFQSSELTSGDLKEQLRQCRWMSRSWTLQELVAARKIQFYDKRWSSIGSKEELILHLTEITGINEAVLKDPECIDDFSVGTRMSWASNRSSRLVEDVAYSLAGLFKVSMQVLYGEGRKAFITLQEKIMEVTDDASLFAWQSNDNQEFRGLLAHHPSEFGHFASWPLKGPLQLRGDISKISGAFSITELSGVKRSGRDIIVTMHSEQNHGNCSTLIGLTFRQWNNRYVRCNPQLILQLLSWPIGLVKKIRINRDLDERASSHIARHMCSYSGPQYLSVEALEGAKTPKGEATEAALARPDSTTLFQSSDAGSSRVGQNSWDSCRHSAELDTVGSGVGTPCTDSHLPLESLSNLSFISCADVYAGVGKRFESPERTGYCTSHTEEASILSVIQDTASDCEDSGEDDLQLFTDPPPEELQLDQTHPFYSVKNELAEHALEQFYRYLSQATEPALAPAHSSTKRTQHEAQYSANKRRKSSFDAHIQINDPQKPYDDEPVEVGYKKPENMSFACPFYRHDQTKYQSCLTRSDLTSIKDVKQHLWAYHRRPYFCSVCHNIFGSADECDAHIRRRSCSLNNGPEIEGITEDQLQQLAVKSNKNQSPGKQWHSIMEIVFPEVEQERLDPYLTGNIETWVCHLREYWTNKGEEVIADFLESKEKREYDEIQDEERNLQALYAVVLNQMIDNTADYFNEASATV